LSTLVSQPSPEPSWKQEVNRRLAEHKSRKGLSVVEQTIPDKAHGAASSRAANAAARVAARYAKAPSFSEMQAAEARAALRTAEAATRVALEAQAAAQAVLANFETAAEEQVEHEEEASVHRVEGKSSDRVREAESTHTTAEVSTGRSFEIRWEQDLPTRPAGPPPQAARHEAVESSEADEAWRTPAARPGDFVIDEDVETVAAQPIHAKLIHFPREIVATRRLRPRLSDDPGAIGASSGQLSIFEVDPSSISIEPMEEEGPLAASSTGAEWSNIELDAQPGANGQTEREPSLAKPVLHLAPFGLRLLATAVDTALIGGLVCAAVAVTAEYMQHPPGVRAAELGAIGALFLTAALYNAFFLMMARATPGMRYAHIALCTFDDENPTPEQIRNRLVAMLLSLLPVGLGMAWAIFDDDRLCWHDRLSRTYPRRY